MSEFIPPNETLGHSLSLASEATPAVDAASSPHRYPLSFTGSGSEYFKIWIVNLLLILITAGIYYPWAKLRKQKYLHRNLMLDGAAFDYHAKPKAMFIGTLVALLLYGAYYLAGNIDNVWVSVSVLACIALISPWLLWKALRFRMSVTTYRALPFGFLGTLKGSYIALLPQFVALCVFLVLISAGNPDKKETYKAVLPWLALAAVLIALAAPALHLWLKRYQHRNYQWTSLRSEFSLTMGRMYLAYLKYFAVIFGLSLGYGAVIGFVAALIGGGALVGMAIGSSGAFSPVLAIIFGLILGLSYFAFYAFCASYFISRFQNLIWNATSAPGLKIESTLSATGLFKVYFVNVLLVGITLGLYWPFAAMRNARFRAASITLVADEALMLLASLQLSQDRERNAMGDAVGDVFGIDIAL